MSKASGDDTLVAVVVLGIGGVLAWGIGSFIHGEWKDAVRKAEVRSGKRPPRWTDKNRWERD